MKKQGVIYRRISDDREGRELGVQRQGDDCLERAERDDVEIIRVYTDNDIGASAKSRKARPEFAQMLRDAEAGAAGRYIYAYSNSRLTRRPREFEDLLDLHDQTGVQIRTIVSGDDNLATADGRMVARMKAVVDAAEAERLSERITRKLAENAAQGRHHGGMRPYGWNDDRTTLNEAEAAVIREAVDRVLAGESIKSVCRSFNSRGITTSTGKVWKDVTLRRMLGNARIAGLREYKGEVVGPGQWESIIPSDRWYELHALLSNPARVQTPGGNGARHMLSGLALCGVCGDVLRVGKGKTYTKKDGTVTEGRRTYRCRSGRVCVMRDKARLEELISAVVIERLSRPDAAGLLAEPEDDEAATAARKVEELQERLQDAANAYAAGKIRLAQMTAITSALEPQIAAAEARATSPTRSRVLTDLVAADDVAAVWASLPASRQRAVIALLMTVTVNPTKHGFKFHPDDVQISWR